MLRELLAKDQSAEGRQPNKPQGSKENTKPTGSNDRNSTNQKDDEDFVPVSHRDLAGEGEPMNVDSHPSDEPGSSPLGAGLQRMSGNLLDLDEDAEHSFLHPLMGHLQGRLLGRSMARNAPKKFAPLHPYTQILSLHDVDECVRIESEAFPEHERCSQEKFIYRLSKCPELSFGVFSKPTLSEAEKSSHPDHAELIALIVGTRTPAPCVTDASMEVPPHWRSRRSSIPAADETEPLGHQDQGGTICIHSLAVGKAHQRKGLGSVLLRAFTQRIRDSKIADRIALICHDHLIGFYKGHGFEDMGPSDATFGGGGWRNMIMELGEQEE